MAALSGRNRLRISPPVETLGRRNSCSLSLRRALFLAVLAAAASSSAMSSASSSRSSFARRGPFIPLVQCHDCGKVVKKYTSRTPQHDGWVFYKCETHSVGFCFTTLSLTFSILFCVLWMNQMLLLSIGCYLRWFLL
jgi:hypothetical protein